MRAQLAQPSQHVLSPQAYLQFMTMHGTGMIAVTITPLALGLGVYLVPLQIGAPRIAAPRATLLGYWLYVAGATTLIWGFLTPDGASDGWWGTYRCPTPFTPRGGESLWTAGVFLAACGMVLQGATTLWTILRLRAPGITMMRLPVFVWTQLVTCLMVAAAFPALLAAMAVVALDRADPGPVQQQHVEHRVREPVLVLRAPGGLRDVLPVRRLRRRAVRAALAVSAEARRGRRQQAANRGASPGTPR